MASFGKCSFPHASYASFRPSYPSRLYDSVLSFHKGPRTLLVDLGSGHGLICRSLAANFKRLVGTDPSAGMIEQARRATHQDEYPNVNFVQSRAESLSFIEDGSVDMVVAGQAAHWFDLHYWFEEMRRVVRTEGTLAFWGYTDPVFRDYSTASKLLHEMAYGHSKDLLGPYWQQPGRSILQNYLRGIQPPESLWEVERQEHDATANLGLYQHDDLVMQERMPVAGVMNYIRTWSSYHGWQEAHPQQRPTNAGGSGDVVDRLFEAVSKAEPEWMDHPNWLEKDIDIVWGTALVLARRKGKEN